MEMSWNWVHNPPSKHQFFFYRKPHFLSSAKLATLEINIDQQTNLVFEPWYAQKIKKTAAILCKKVTKYKTDVS